MNTHTTVDSVLLVIALVLFLLAAFGVKSPRLNLVAFGLALYIATLLF